MAASERRGFCISEDHRLQTADCRNRGLQSADCSLQSHRMYNAVNTITHITSTKCQ
jgi:hypothetical protein